MQQQPSQKKTLPPTTKKTQKAIKIQQKGSKTNYVYDKRVSFQVDQHYKINEIIGRGVYGVVAEGQNMQTGQKVAVKLIKQLFRDPGEAKRQLQFLKHKNIVSLLDIMKIQDPKNFTQIYLVLQFMQYNLRKLIQSKNPINQNMIKFILFQILDGLHHMHSADIIHRDLKPQNILINQKLELKIADMNLARKQDDNPTEYVVTRPYRALQVFLCSKSYNKSIDIWSVGCIFAELIGRTVLFQGIDCLDQLKRFVAILGKPNLEHYENVDPLMKQTFLQIIRQIPDRSKIDWRTLFPNANPDALDLLDHMLEYDAKVRYSAEECLNHPFLRELRQKCQLKKCQIQFDFSFDDIPMEIDAIRKAIYDEARMFHPEEEVSTEGIRRDRPCELSKQLNQLQKQDTQKQSPKSPQSPNEPDKNHKKRKTQ